MNSTPLKRSSLFLACILLTACATPSAAAPDVDESQSAPLRVLFLGNSFTGRHDLAKLVETMAATGQPSCALSATTVTYGGRTMRDHWNLHSQDWVRLAELTEEELSRSIAQLRAASQLQPESTHLPSAITRHEDLRSALSERRPKWDYVVLQSWRDTTGGLDSAYVEYARRFAQLARSQGAKVVFYDTAPEFQHAQPLAVPPDRAPAEDRARILAQLAAEFDALVIPMPLVAWHCQSARPDVTLRYVNDGHPNQTMAYLTAATFYAVLVGRSSAGLPVSEVTDNKVTDRAHPDRDPDGGPRRKLFDDDLRLFLQRTVDDALADFRQLALTPDPKPAAVGR